MERNDRKPFLNNTLMNSLVLPRKRRNYLFLDRNGPVLCQLSRTNTLTRKPGAGNMMVHAWFSSTAALAKTMWTMAISQHQFYLDKKQVEVRVLQNQSNRNGWLIWLSTALRMRELVSSTLAGPALRVLK